MTVIHPLAVTWRAVDPHRRAPFDFQPWMSLSGDAKQNCLSILVAPFVFEEARGGAVPICMCAVVFRAQPFIYV